MKASSSRHNLMVLVGDNINDSIPHTVLNTMFQGYKVSLSDF